MTTKDKPFCLEDYITWVHEYELMDEKDVHPSHKTNICEVALIKQALAELDKRIRQLPNRDDKIMSRVKLLDGGGVNRFEVLKIIEEVFGKSLIKQECEEK